MRISDWSSDVCSSDLESRRRADTYLKGGFGGLVGFELTGGAAAGRRFIDALQLFYHVANLGDARSLAIHPASPTPSPLTPEDQHATGVMDNYVPLSVRPHPHHAHLADPPPAPHPPT